MKFKKWLDEQTTTGAIALNLTRGNVDVVGADCPEGKVKTSKGLCVDKPKPKTKLAKQFVSEYDEGNREDIYQNLAKEIMKKHKGKKVIPAQVVQDAVVGYWAGDAPYDKMDYQEIADILKKKGIKLKGGIR